MTSERQRFRVLAIYAHSGEEIQDLLIDPGRVVLYPHTRFRAAPDEPVLVDLRLTDWRILLWARAHYTAPEGRGPCFAFSPADRALLKALLAAGTVANPRTRLRFPLRPRLLVWAPGDVALPGRLLDLSACFARIEAPVDLPSGTPLEIELLDADAFDLPHRLSACILCHRSDGLIVHFTDRHRGAWKRLRLTLRRIDETGALNG